MKINYEEIWSSLRQRIGSNPIYYTDWVGILWPNSSFPAIPDPSLSSDSFPYDGDAFRAGRIEWEAFGFAIAIAKNTLNDKATAIELGSSASPWALAFTKSLRELKEVETVSIEAGDVQKLASMFWKVNNLNFKVKRKLKSFSFNGVNFTAVFYRGLATNNSKKYFFPKVDVGQDNGATGSSDLANLDYRGLKKATKISGIDVFSKLKNYSNVDFLHMDIQGSEVEIIQDSRFETLAYLTSVILIGTHSAKADTLAHELDGKFGLNLISFEESQPGAADGKWPVDGEFFFLNDKAFKLSKRLGLFI